MTSSGRNGTVHSQDKSSYQDSTSGSTEDVSSINRSPENDVEEEEVDTSCGFNSSCKPSWLQVCANPKTYLVVASLCSIVQGFAVNGINNVNISSYERRYLLSSKNSGLVASFYDIAAGLTVLFVGYFGATAHQPRILGVAVLSLGLGTLIMAMAHFTAPPYEPGANLNQTLVCSLSGDVPTCDAGNSQESLKNYLYVLLLGQALNGFGGTCLYSLGYTYLDESVSTKMSPLYIGLMSGSSVLGPAIGYIVGGYLLEIYVEPGNQPDTLTSAHPAWVGAWWLGFVVSSILSFLLAVFMFLFPKEMPGTKAIKAAKISQAHCNGTEELVNTAGFGMSWRHLPKATWFLLKNPTYMCLCAVTVLEFAIAAGMSTFLPKYIANQFAETASWSAMLTGFMAVPGAALGQVTGGYVCKKFNLKLPGILRLLLGSSILALCTTPVMWARCPTTNIAGVAITYPDVSGGSSKLDDVMLNGQCNAGCGCDTSFYEPVCSNGVQYFSSCYAGCSQPFSVNEIGVKEYYNCSCPHSTNPGFISANSSVVTAGPCEADCQVEYYLFIIFGFIMFFFSFMMGSPMTVATLRVVPEKQRAYGISLQWVFLRFLGSLPGPIIFGSMIDASCQVMEVDCGVEGSCWIYDSFEMSQRLFILVVVLKVMSIFFNILAIFFYKPPPKEQEVQLNDTNGVYIEGTVTSQDQIITNQA